MQLLHLLCPRKQTFSLEQSFKDQFMDQDAFGVVDVGFVEKQPVGFVVLMAREQFDEEFLAQVYADPDVTGYSTFSFPDDDAFLYPFGSEVLHTA
ncbi:hypothetical protein KSF_061300 [Reticulibacter mediterranei]|uniref:Uncharacterized protein n=1 Tax=Reticulibacter mediterranei TaxID=2778369 RepID=A0A8J3N2Q8_9CHLR|nr:hypothetical protein [Reticulibacter mediterranei]GHO96082.1 hypothetical protein KSF_061300 [Reticulibacter mediterranei]